MARDDAPALHLRPASVEHLLAVDSLWPKMDPAARQVLVDAGAPDAEGRRLRVAGPARVAMMAMTPLRPEGSLLANSARATRLISSRLSALRARRTSH